MYFSPGVVCFGVELATVGHNPINVRCTTTTTDVKIWKKIIKSSRSDRQDYAVALL